MTERVVPGLTDRGAPGSPRFVLGVDVGFAESRATTCFCILGWDETGAWTRFACACADHEHRRRALRGIVPADAVLEAVAIDGPLTHGLRRILHYRAAEALLSCGVFQRLGKPGQTNSPVGQALHEHATRLAELVLCEADAGRFAVRPSLHFQPIHPACIVEAFPNLFLAALIPEASLVPVHRNASDRYWEVLVKQTGGLEALVCHLLPSRGLDPSLPEIRDHEHRAGLICALTALAVARQDYAGVGDPHDGDIMLPPPALWGASAGGPARWMEQALRDNLPRVRTRSRHHENHRNARVTSFAGQWFP